MVSIVEDYWMAEIFMILANEEKRVFLCEDDSDAAGGDAVMLQRGDCGVGGFGGYRDEQSAGGLGIEE
jgi:hypothetical protein